MAPSPAPRPVRHAQPHGAPAPHRVPYRHVLAVTKPQQGLGAEDTAGAHALGVSLLLTGVGTAVGTAMGGAWGAVSGLFFGGALANGWRAAKYAQKGDEKSDHEALISASYAIAGLAAGGYVAWTKTKKEKAT